MEKINPSFLFAGFAAILVLSSSLYTVTQNEQALILQFGQAKRVVNVDGDDAGLKLKVPFTENVRFFDRRVLDYTPSSVSEIVAADQEPGQLKVALEADFAAIKSRGATVAPNGEPHLVAPLGDKQLWMGFFSDPDGNLFALMQLR